jgi:hypothetical protein
MPKNWIYLPSEKDLPVNKLAACFNNTVATYKYYWFLSLIQAVESGLALREKVIIDNQ